MTQVVSTAKFEYGADNDFGWSFVSEDLGVELWQKGRQRILVDRIGLMNDGVVDITSPEILRLYENHRAPRKFLPYITRM